MGAFVLGGFADSSCALFRALAVLVIGPLGKGGFTLISSFHSLFLGKGEFSFFVYLFRGYFGY